MVGVSNEWNVHMSKAALFARCADPSKVRELTVSRRGKHFATDLAKLLGTIGERNDLGWTHESTAMLCIVATTQYYAQVERVEEEHDVSAAVVAQGYILELAVDDRRRFESGRLATDKRLRHVCLQQFKRFSPRTAK